MTDRVDDFLQSAGWRNAQRIALAGDMSHRRYLRLKRSSGETAILMDVPTDKDASTPAFVAMTYWLRTAGFSAPRIIDADAENGLLLLEDFGDWSVTRLVKHDPGMTRDVYHLILDLLLVLRAHRPPLLDCPSAADLVRMTDLIAEEYPGIQAAELEPFRACLETNLAQLDMSPTISLRDFHADNLMWLPDRSGIARFGLLDYQDAFLTHPVYDVVSLLTDARTDIAPELRDDMVSAYLLRSSDDQSEFRTAFSLFSAQRNMRILGIFARAAAQGKPTHVDKLPRVYRYLTEALQHPIFSKVKDRTLAAIPAPSDQFASSIR